MTEFIGRLIDVGIGKESARGTSVTPDFWLPALAKNVDDVFTLAKDEAARGVIETDEDAKVVSEFAEGEIEGYVRDKSFGLILLGTLGAVVSNVDTPEAGVQTHDYTVAQSAQHQSLTLSLKHPLEDIRFANGMVTSLEIIAELNTIVKFTLGFMGFKGTDESDTVSYDTSENEFCPQHMTVKFAADLAGLDAANAIKAKTVSITFAKNLETDDVLGQIAPDDILNKQFMVEGTVELNYEDTKGHSATRHTASYAY